MNKADNIKIKDSSSYHHQDLREALIEAAWDSIQKHGFESLSLAALAKEVGVSQAAPYRHFSDRNALLAAVAQRGFIVLMTQQKIAVDTGRKGTPLWRLANVYADFGTENAEIYRLMFTSPLLGNSPEGSELRTTAKRDLDLFFSMFDDIPNPKQRKRKAVHVWAALHGAVMLTNQNLLEKGSILTPLKELVDTIVTS
jgi:AcrR family transcriptional regulator